MRLFIKIFEREIYLPVHHNELIQSMIYDVISDPALRCILHDIGFPIGQRRFKLFCFSRLMGDCRFVRAKGQFVFGPNISLVISSPIGMLIQEIGQSLLRRGWIRLSNHYLEIKTINVSEFKQTAGKLVVSMLSPLTVYSTEIREGKKYTHYYEPTDDCFGDLIKANLEKKYLLVKGKKMGDSFEITPLEITRRDRKVIKYKGTWIVGWMGKYILEGDPDILKVAYDAGLGPKNSQGFGCFEVQNFNKTY